MEKGKKPEPLKISCSTTDCESNLHCFQQSQKKAQNRHGPCIKCGAELVDWQRVHKCDIADAEHTFDMLKHEFIRHHFWHVKVDQRALNYARRKGKTTLREACENRIRKYVAEPGNAWDGRQTPFHSNPIYYAQHATACCCRKCIQEWHAISPDRPLTENEIGYFVELMMLYVQERIPDLADEGTYVPPIRSK